MGTWVRRHDCGIAGHGSCELRRYLDSVPPETPIRDVVDRCRVWESHADPEIRRVSKPSPDPIYPAYVIGDSDKVVEEIRVVAITKIYIRSNGRIAPTITSGCGYFGFSSSSGSGGSGGRKVATASGGGNADSTACSGVIVMLWCVSLVGRQVIVRLVVPL